jgi:hypothetical protein
MADSSKSYTFHGDVGSVENQGHIVGSGSHHTINSAADEVKGDYAWLFPGEQTQPLLLAVQKVVVDHLQREYNGIQYSAVVHLQPGVTSHQFGNYRASHNLDFLYSCQRTTKV